MPSLNKYLFVVFSIIEYNFCRLNIDAQDYAVQVSDTTIAAITTKAHKQKFTFN